MEECCQGGEEKEAVWELINLMNEWIACFVCLRPQPIWSASQHSGASEASLKSPSRLTDWSPAPSDRAHRERAHIFTNNSGGLGSLLTDIKSPRVRKDRKRCVPIKDEHSEAAQRERIWLYYQSSQAFYLLLFFFFLFFRDNRKSQATCH